MHSRTGVERRSQALRITIDVTPAIQQHAGIGRYAEQLTRALLALNTGDEVGLFFTDAQGREPGPPLNALPRTAMRWANKPWRMRVLMSSFAHAPMNSLVGDIDIFHATDHLLPPLRGIRSVFTLHDLSYLTHPETHLPLNRLFLRLMVPRFLQQADAIICVSQHTKKDALRFYRLDEARIHVVPSAVEPRFRSEQDPERLAAVRACYGLPERFILFVSTIEPRKNLVTLLEAHKVLLSEGRPEKLVVVGKKGWLHEATFSRLRELGLEEQVVFPGYVDEEDLPAFYALATCFAFPSLYEGFGLTPLEAMASGCPVVCSNTSSLPEVCGDAAIVVPPTDVAALASAIGRLLADVELREDLRARGVRRAARFTWRDAAEKTLHVYRDVLKHSVRDEEHRERPSYLVDRYVQCCRQEPAEANVAPKQKAMVILPTYNEAKNLPKMIEQLLALPLDGYDLSVLVVDDNSPDGTGRIADEMARSRPGQLEVMHRAGKQGLGTAYVAGFRHALAADAAIVVQMDADFSHSPSYVPALIGLLSSSDVAIGSRYVAGGGLDERWGLSRRVLSKGGNMYARFITGLHVHDVTAGFKAFRRASLAALDLDRIKSDGYAFQIEVAYACHKQGLRMAELPITFMDRTYGTSKMSLSIVLEAMWRTWQTKWRY